MQTKKVSFVFFCLKKIKKVLLKNKETILAFSPSILNPNPSEEKYN